MDTGPILVRAPLASEAGGVSWGWEGEEEGEVKTKPDRKDRSQRDHRDFLEVQFE